MKQPKVPPPPTNPDVPCNCMEVFINEVRVARPKWHDCTYIHQRNSHLTAVCSRADDLVSKMPTSTEEERCARRNARALIISREMDKIGRAIITNQPTNANNNQLRT